MLGYPDKSPRSKVTKHSQFWLMSLASEVRKQKAAPGCEGEMTITLMNLSSSALYVSPYFWNRGVGLPQETDGVPMDMAPFRHTCKAI